MDKQRLQARRSFLSSIWDQLEAKDRVFFLEPIDYEIIKVFLPLKNEYLPDSTSNMICRPLMDNLGYYMIGYGELAMNIKKIPGSMHSYSSGGILGIKKIKTMY